MRTASRSRMTAVGLAAGVAAALFGCGGSGYQVVSARGTVLCNGEPVTSGSIIFTPIAEAGQMEPGKPATAGVDVDGTFVLRTYDKADGAIVGKHRVLYTPPEGEDEEEEEAAKTAAVMPSTTPPETPAPSQPAGSSSEQRNT